MINAIQQLGLGVLDKNTALDWFARVLGFRTVIFDEQGEAKHMSRYTDNEVCERAAALVLNSHGGAGLEIWQHISREPLRQPKNMCLQSTGFLICKLRCRGLKKIVASLQRDTEPSLQLLGDISAQPTGENCCYFSVFGTWFQLVEDTHEFFAEENSPFCAGILGVVIGVSDMASSLKFYRNALGYRHVVQDQTMEKWRDWWGFYSLHKNNEGKFRRVLLRRELPETGLYAKLFGVGEIELIAAESGPLQPIRAFLHLEKKRHLYYERCWGDPGLIHMCFDVTDMSSLRNLCHSLELNFTVDTGTNEFSMGKTAAGRFAYLEDPDGSLIEFVETYRLPLVKKWGLSLNVRGKKKPLPRWLLKLASRDNYRQGSRP